MINKTKLVQILRKLEREEWKNLRKFLRSPYFNTNEKVVALADAIYKFHPEYDQKNCTQAYLFAKIFGKKSLYQEQKLAQLMTQLVKLVEKFLMQERFEKEEMMQQQIRLKCYDERQLDNFFFKEVEKQQTHWLLSEERNATFHQSMLLLNEAIFHHVSTKKAEPMLTSWVEGYTHFQRYVLWKTMDWGLMIENRQRLLGETHNTIFIDAILESQKEFIAHDVYLRIAQLIIRYQRKPDAKILFLIKEDFEENFQDLKPEEGLTMIRLISSLVSQKIREGNKEFQLLNFEIHKIQFHAHFAFLNKNIDTDLYIKAITMACICLDFEWALYILEKYKFNLVERKKKNTYKYGKVTYLFSIAMNTGSKEKFHQTVETYNSIDKIPQKFEIAIRSKIIRCYYEIFQSTEAERTFLVDYCNSFQKFLSRKKQMNEERKMTFLLFITQMKKLIKLKYRQQSTKQELDEFHDFIIKTDNIFARQWLLEKIVELKI